MAQPQLRNANAQLRRQDCRQAEAHLEPDQTILHRQRRCAGSEKARRDADGEHEVPRAAQRRAFDDVDERDDHVDAYDRKREEMKEREVPPMILVVLRRKRHSCPPGTERGRRAP